MLTKCPELEPFTEDEIQMGVLYSRAVEMLSIYTECAIRHDFLSDTIKNYNEK